MGEEIELSASERARLVEFEWSLWRAETRFDRAYMEQILAPDFFEYGRSGRVYTRAQCLDAAPVEFSTALDGMRIRLIDPNVAQITYISRVTYGPEVEIGNRSSIWSRVPGGWQLRFHQGTVRPE